MRSAAYGNTVILLGGLWMVREWGNPAAPGPLVFTIGIDPHMMVKDISDRPVSILPDTAHVIRELI